MNEGVAVWLARPQGLLQGIEDELCVHATTNPSAHNPSGKDVGNERHEHDTLPCAYVGEVRDPQLVEPLSNELAIDPVEQARCCGVGVRGAKRLPDHAYA